MSPILLLISFTICLITYMLLRRVLPGRNLAHNIARKTTGVLTLILIAAILLPTPPAYATTITEYQIPGNPGVWELAVNASHVWYTEGAGNNIGVIAYNNGTFPAVPLRQIPVPTPNSQPWGITAVGWNNIAAVFTEGFSGKIGVVAANSSFRILEYNIPTVASGPRKIVYDNRRNCTWFTENSAGKIGCFNVSKAPYAPPHQWDASFFEYPLASGSAPIGIAVDPRGGGRASVWYADYARQVIGELQPEAAVVKEYSISGVSPWDVAVDSNGVVWFTAQSPTGTNFIGSINPVAYQGILTWNAIYIPTPNCQAHDIQIDSIGNIWFTEYADNVGKVGKFTPITNSLTEYTIVTPNAKPQGLAIFQDSAGVRNIWFTEYGGRKIARLRQPEGPTVTSTVYSLSSIVSASMGMPPPAPIAITTASATTNRVTTGTSYSPLTTVSTTTSILTDTSSTVILSPTYFTTTYSTTTSTSWTTTTTTVTYTVVSGETTSTTTSTTVTAVSVTWQSITLLTSTTYVSTSMFTQTTSTTLTTTQNITVFSPTVSVPTTTNVGVSTTIYSPVVTVTSTTLTQTTTTTTSTIPTTTTLYSPTVTVTSSTTTVTTILPIPAIRPCIIASAAYGSELAAPVQFLREFRNNDVLSTFAGARFMDVFNSFYYSFSPAVASVVASSPVLKEVVRALIYPLISVLGVSSILFNGLSYSPEIGMIIAGILASALIGVVYITPPVVVIRYLTKKKTCSKET